MNEEEAIRKAEGLYAQSGESSIVQRVDAIYLKKHMFGGKGLKGWQVVLQLDRDIEPNEFIVEIYEPDYRAKIIQMI